MRSRVSNQVVVFSLYLFAVQTVFGFVPKLSAQGTAEDYARAERIRLFRNRVSKDSLSWQWFGNGVLVTKKKDGKSTFQFVDGETGKVTESDDKKKLGRSAKKTLLVPKTQWQPSKQGELEVELTFENTFDRPVRIYWSGFNGQLRSFGEVKARGNRTIRTFEGHWWVVDFNQNDLAGVFVAANSDCIARLDKDSQRIAMKSFNRPPVSQGARTKPVLRVDSHNVWLDSKVGKPIRLTANGKEDDYYQSKFQYSPNGEFAFGFQTTKVEARRIPLVDSTPDDQVQPKLAWHRYVKPGDVMPQRRPRMFNLKKAKQVKVEDAEFLDSWSVSFLRWSPDGNRAYVRYNQRGHQLLSIKSIDAKTGRIDDIVKETSNSFVDYSQKQELHWLDQTDELIWASERDGWNHLYRINAQTGEVVNQITKGKWVVRKVEYVDEANQVIWFTCMGIYPDQDPYFHHLARVNFDGSNLVFVTESDGTHHWTFNQKRTLIVDRWSRVDQPEVTELRRTSDGSLVKTLHEEDQSELRSNGYRPPIRFSAPGRDGKTLIYGHLIQPSNFDSEKKYPVVEHIYAGPHDFHVPKRFGLQISQRRLAELGFIVVQIDGMGTNWRSKKFHDVCWQNLLDGGFPDRIAWLRAAAKKYPWLDISRVGIYGGSAGGQNALAALLHHGDFYDAAASDCGCHDNRMDKIWWNEAWMGKFGPHYEANSNVTHAGRLKGNLLLTVGELDRNVDPASTLQVVDALIRANKDFDFIMVPGAGHGIGESDYLFRRRQDFFVRTLMKVEPRR